MGSIWFRIAPIMWFRIEPIMSDSAGLYQLWDAVVPEGLGNECTRAFF